MVDWDRVQELREKGWDWERIADDAKVGFHPDASVRDPGRALRALYHRQRSRTQRQRGGVDAPPAKQATEVLERRWTLARFGYLLTPIFAIWFTVAFLVPSPVGLVVAAIPYLALGLVVVAFALLFGLWRSKGPRWTKVFRSTAVLGIVLGLVLSAIIAIGGILFFGCPVLPPASAATQQPGAGWTSVSVSSWQDGGKVVVYFYGATWCPYCSASSWAIWKALTEFGSVSGTVTDYSSSTDVYPSTPEIVLAGTSVSSAHLAFQVSEDTSGVESTFPATANCVQQAYVSAYSGGSIPFLAINGQYLHGGSSLINPPTLSTWAGGANGGAGEVQKEVSGETGPAWSAVQDQAWWTMAFIAKASGVPVSQLASTYHWSSATQSAVTSDVAAIR